jgi:hypothetical protein
MSIIETRHFPNLSVGDFRKCETKRERSGSLAPPDLVPTPLPHSHMEDDGLGLGPLEGAADRKFVQRVGSSTRVLFDSDAHRLPQAWQSCPPARAPAQTQSGPGWFHEDALRQAHRHGGTVVARPKPWVPSALRLHLRVVVLNRSIGVFMTRCCVLCLARSVPPRFCHPVRCVVVVGRRCTPGRASVDRRYKVVGSSG